MIITLFLSLQPVTYRAGCISNCSIGCNDVILTAFLSLQPVQKAPMELLVSVTVERM